MERIRQIPSQFGRLAAVLVIWGVVVFAAAADARADGKEDDALRLAERVEMVRTVGAHAAFAAEVTGIGEIDPRIMEALAKVPRHEFVPDALRDFAYADMPLPVGHDQSISQPYLVALMTHLAHIGADDTVFETGTGAGYHAAILSLLAKRVVSVEVVAPLALEAAAKLKRLGYGNVEVIGTDGYYGAPRQAPFDAMIVKEAVDHVPPALVQQLKPGGRMVLPLGPRDGPQYLTVIEKTADGGTRGTRILPVRFTPLQGGERI